MIETVLGHGFPESTSSSKLHNHIIAACLEQIRQHMPVDKTAVAIDNTWLYFSNFSSDGTLPSDKLIALYKKHPTIDYLFVFSMIDPLAKFWPLNNNVKKTIEIGVTTKEKGIPLDFWAMNCADILHRYTQQEVELSQDVVPFLCYQFKPHLHRQKLTLMIKEAGLLDKGIVTLGKFHGQDYNFPGLEQLYIPDPEVEIHHPGESDTFNVSGTVLPFRLGNLDIWRRCFLYVSSESSYNSIRPFVSEKTWKAVVGLRPFVLNAAPGAYQWLEAAGIDTFEDLWCGQDLRNEPSMTVRCQMITNILKHYSAKSKEELYQLYQSLLPRLIYNKNRFYEYAEEQRKLIPLLITSETFNTKEEI